MRLSKTLPLLLIGLAQSQLSYANDDEISDDEIIVTAKRYAEPAKNYAGSVSVLSAGRLQKISAVHPAEALNEIAGVNIHRGSGQEHLTAIRSPVLTGGAGAGSFLYLEDGVPLRAAGFANVNGLFEGALELAGGVEVTKGPGSVLYGSNAVHGLVNILSQTPSQSRGLSLDLLGNELGYVRLKTSFSGAALSGRYRLSGSFATDPGFRADSGFDQQKIQLRHDVQAGEWAVKTLASFQNLNQETAGFITGVDAFRDPVLAASNPNPEAFRDGRTARIAVHLNKAVSENGRVSFIPYARSVDLTFLRHFVPGQALEESGHKSIGLLSSYENQSAFGRYTLGFDAEYTKGFTREFQSGPSVFSFIQGEHYDYEIDAVVLSPYVQTRFELGARTKINVGARADYTAYTYDNQIDNGSFGRFLRVADRQDDYFTISPKLGITHDLNENITLYSRLARGSRAPQVSDVYSLQINQTPGTIKPETLDSLEFGLKGNAGQLNIEAAVFAMRKDNFFFRNANGFNVENGKTRHVGIEVEFNMPLSRHIDLSGGVTLANHTYAFTDIVGSPSSSITEGDQVDSAPNTLGFMQMTAKPIDSLNVSLKWQHVGSYYTDPGNTAKYEGHDIFTLRGQYDVSQRISLYGRVDNIFDTAFANRADFAFGSNRFFPGRPRTVFFGISFKD
ncbi:MAG: TonB-dependent receptor [Robiginitomaculum sp.]|nr:TonB-dependent receptor [Robiginitomaculum sp.]